MLSNSALADQVLAARASAGASQLGAGTGLPSYVQESFSTAPVQEAAKRGKFNSLAQQAATKLANKPGMRGILGRQLLSKPGFARYGLVPFAATVASEPAANLVDQYLDESGAAGDVLSGALQGAGLGFTAGAITPIPLLDEAAGAILGGLGGAAWGLFKGGRRGKSVEDQVAEGLQEFGVTGQMKDQIVDTYRRVKDASGEDAANQWAATVLQTAQEDFMTNLGNPLRPTTGEAAPQDLVLQQYAGQLMKPYVDAMNANITSAQDALRTQLAGPNVDPTFAAAAAPLVSQWADLNRANANAAALQAQAFPILNRIAQSQWQASQGGGGGGLSDLLNQAITSGALPTQ